MEIKLDEQFRDEKNEILKEKVVSPVIDEKTDISSLVDSMKDMSIQARNIGLCAEVFENMLKDEEKPTILLGLAGPLIAGGLRNVISGMIKNNMVDAIVSTGAIMYQDIYQALGHSHFKGATDADDAVLRDYFIDRIYDTYVDEEKFWATDTWIGRMVDEFERRPHSSRELIKLLTEKHLDDDNSILCNANKKNIPVFIPAINDSSIGIGLTDHYHRAKKEGKEPVRIDSIRDNYELTQIVVNSKKTAAIYIAGGVPKNYINDSVVMSYIFDKEDAGHEYCFQVTTAVINDGGLSSSTLDEAKSWGKVKAKANRAMAWVEPTVALPLIYGSVLQKGLSKNRKAGGFEFENDILTKY